MRITPSRTCGHPWNHKQVYRIYYALELKRRIKPRKRLKREKPEALAVPEAPPKNGGITRLPHRV